LTVTHETSISTNILRKELNIDFDKDSDDHLIAKIAQSGSPNPRNWWIYHQSNYSGANTEFNVAKDTKLEQKVESDALDYIKEEDLFKNPEKMLWKVVKYCYDARE
jgi:hypothetical protein